MLAWAGQASTARRWTREQGAKQRPPLLPCVLRHCTHRAKGTERQRCCRPTMRVGMGRGGRNRDCVCVRQPEPALGWPGVQAGGLGDWLARAGVHLSARPAAGTYCLAACLRGRGSGAAGGRGACAARLRCTAQAWQRHRQHACAVGDASMPRMPHPGRGSRASMWTCPLSLAQARPRLGFCRVAATEFKLAPQVRT